MPINNKEIEQENTILHRSRSEEVQDIMGQIPSWVTRWGITLLALVFIGTLFGSYFFKYPDIINAKVIISSANPPVKLIAKNNLPIKQLFVKNSDNVQEGQILCMLSSTVNYRQATAIASLCARMDTTVDISALMGIISLPTEVNLGELQSPYISLFQAIQSYRFFIAHNNYHSKLNHLNDQSAIQGALSEELRKRDDKLKQQLEIQQHQFLIDSSLVTNGIISRVEYEKSKKDLLNQQMNTNGNYSTILQSRLQEKEIRKNIAETSIELQTQENELKQKVREAAKAFNGAYTQWEQDYVIRTPVAGKVTFFKFWKENQFVLAGEAVMVVTPTIQNYVARGEIAIVGAGKVKPGQRVLIKLLAYPFEEYGSLTGRLQSRSVVALDSTFAVEINIENRLRTNAGKIIPDQPQFEGFAEIMTDNRSILHRLFDNLIGKRRQ